jgi:trans-2,3-dihydro-3-hydroxyanthranilate isomerase
MARSSGALPVALANAGGKMVNGRRNVSVKKHGIPFELYDAFAARRFGGNVAGVVICEAAIAPPLMQAIASELGAPTTGFAQAGAGQPVSIRFFTPRQEIGACGHVTVAVATALVQRGIWPAGDGQAKVITPAGRLPISLRAAATPSSPATLAGLAYQPRSLGPEGVTREDAEAALATPAHPGLPIEVIWTGLRHLIVPAGSQQALARIAPSEAALTGLAASGGADTVCVFASAGDHRVRMRDFCAPIGALEEPASGTTSAALASYLTRHATAPTPTSIVIEQGAEMGRPSQIEVDVQTQRGQTVATVWGSALRTASGTVFPA